MHRCRIGHMLRWDGHYLELVGFGGYSGDGEALAEMKNVRL